MSITQAQERKIGIWGIGEPLGATIAELLVEGGVRPSDIVGIYTRYTSWVQEMQSLGVELHQEAQTPKGATGLPQGRIFERFIFVPTSDQSPRSLQGAVTRYLAKSVGDGRQVRHFCYVGPCYDSSAFYPSQSVYPAMEYAIQTKAHVFSILRHSLLLDEVFSLEWLVRSLRDGGFPILRGSIVFNFCRVEEIARAVVRALSFRDMPDSLFHWRSDLGEGFKAHLCRAEAQFFTLKDVVFQVKKHFGKNLRWRFVEPTEAKEILQRRGITCISRYDNATDASHSLLCLRPELYRLQSSHLNDLLGLEAVGSLYDYFADLKADYLAYLARQEKLAEAQPSQSEGSWGERRPYYERRPRPVSVAPEASEQKRAEEVTAPAEKPEAVTADRPAERSEAVEPKANQPAVEAEPIEEVTAEKPATEAQPAVEAQPAEEVRAEVKAPAPAEAQPAVEAETIERSEVVEPKAPAPAEAQPAVEAETIERSEAVEPKAPAPAESQPIEEVTAEKPATEAQP